MRVNSHINPETAQWIIPFKCSEGNSISTSTNFVKTGTFMAGIPRCGCSH